MLERMGVRVMSERGYQLSPEAGGPLWVHDFSLQLVGRRRCRCRGDRTAV